MFVLRSATSADVQLIASHRKAMFVAMGHPAESLDPMDRHFVPWLRSRLAEGFYLGWVATVDGLAVGSAGMMLVDWPPNLYDPAGTVRGYLLNVFVEEAYRRRGIARMLVETCLAEARRRRIQVISLHASAAGRPLYEGMGFAISNEMYRIEPGE